MNKTVCKCPNEDCYYRQCENCSDINVSDLLMNSEDDLDEKPDTTWSLWVNVNNHVELQHFSGSFRSLIDKLNNLWPSFITHTFVTRQNEIISKH